MCPARVDVASFGALVGLWVSLGRAQNFCARPQQGGARAGGMAEDRPFICKKSGNPAFWCTPTDEEALTI